MKREYRTQIQKWRSSLPEQEWLNLSKLVCDRLRSLIENLAVSRIHSFWPLESNKEVDIRELLLDIHADGAALFMPVMKGSIMHHGRFTSENELSAGQFNVLEPSDHFPSIPPNLDCVIAPALVVDRHGGRIGYGKGIYDRFLAQVDCPIITPVFSAQIVSYIEQEPHDVSVDILVSESAILHV